MDHLFDWLCRLFHPFKWEILFLQDVGFNKLASGANNFIIYSYVTIILYLEIISQ